MYADIGCVQKEREMREGNRERREKERREGQRGERKRGEREKPREERGRKGEEAVSYTHLTLPTNREV